MSMSIRPFVDQENASQVNVTSRPLSASIGRGPVGKTFQSTNTSFSHTPARRALGDLNTGGKSSISLDQKAANAILAHLKPALPASKPLKSKTQEKTRLGPKKSQVKSGSVEVKKKAQSSIVEDRENMFLPPDEPDNFEDLWPLSERPTTYLAGAKSWRSTKCFMIYQESDSDDSMVNLSDAEDDTDNPTRTKDLSIHIPLDIQEEILPSLEEIDMPSLEELGLL